MYTVDDQYRELQRLFLVPSITPGAVSFIVFIFCDLNDVNAETISAAAAAWIPVTGSGGTSPFAMAVARRGVRIVGNTEGSVATTTYTRTVSYCHTLVDA